MIARAEQFTSPHGDQGPNPSRWSLFKREAESGTLDGREVRLGARSTSCPRFARWSKACLPMQRLDAIVYPTSSTRPGLIAAPASTGPAGAVGDQHREPDRISRPDRARGVHQRSPAGGDFVPRPGVQRAEAAWPRLRVRAGHQGAPPAGDDAVTARGDRHAEIARAADAVLETRPQIKGINTDARSARGRRPRSGKARADSKPFLTAPTAWELARALPAVAPVFDRRRRTQSLAPSAARRHFRICDICVICGRISGLRRPLQRARQSGRITVPRKGRPAMTSSIRRFAFALSIAVVVAIALLPAQQGGTERRRSAAAHRPGKRTPGHRHRRAHGDDPDERRRAAGDRHLPAEERRRESADRLRQDALQLQLLGRAEPRAGRHVHDHRGRSSAAMPTSARTSAATSSPRATTTSSARRSPTATRRSTTSPSSRGRTASSAPPGAPPPRNGSRRWRRSAIPATRR